MFISTENSKLSINPFDLSFPSCTTKYFNKNVALLTWCVVDKKNEWLSEESLSHNYFCNAGGINSIKAVTFIVNLGRSHSYIFHLVAKELIKAIKF